LECDVTLDRLAALGEVARLLDGLVFLTLDGLVALGEVARLLEGLVFLTLDGLAALGDVARLLDGLVVVVGLSCLDELLVLLEGLSYRSRLSSMR
jgi:hypothetical protein